MTEVATDPSTWRFSRHATERARERFGPTCAPRTLRRMLEQAEGWTQLEGDLNEPESRVVLASQDIPGLRFVVGWERTRREAAPTSGRHVLITILDIPRPRDPAVNGGNDATARRMYRKHEQLFKAGRTTRERYMRMRNEPTDD